ncbi:MAG: ADP-forming succinate--CoA ligase subunit beta [Armatimonadota bacterium]|jgi:succinyl-CoA synthetase beta subunit
MKIHEYQAKEVLRAHGAVTPNGRVASTPDQAFEIAADLGGKVVVKAQVHVGGRGKAGGIKVADDPAAARDIAEAMLGTDLKGLTVEKVLVEEAIDIAQEYYLGIVLDRSGRCNTLMVSAEGGVDIEELAERSPEKIAKLAIDPGRGLADFQMRQVCYDAAVDRKIILPACKFLRGLYSAYLAVDANLAEINPLVVTGAGEVVAADAKINVDDSALYRQPEIADLAEESEADEIEVEAARRGIQYVRLDGDVGVLGNGAGLVMATLDEVKNAGGAPANFLDIGGGARADLVRNSLDLIMITPGVKGIFCNVFGGITRCDEVARGIVAAKAKLDIAVPMVVRLTGTNEEEGRGILADAGLVAADSMQEGAAKIVELTT